MKIKRILSLFLALMFAASIVAEASAIEVSAAYADKVDENGNPIINYTTAAYDSVSGKLKDMRKASTTGNYSIYIEDYSGEIAFVNDKTGKALFSNPYDLGMAGNANSKATKETLLSQIVLTYEEDNVWKTMNSFKDATKNQIKAKKIKNGIRMEYTIGEVQVTRLVPRRIPKERFETLILDKISNEFHKERLSAFYQLYDRSDTKLTETMVKEMEAAFPITKRMAIYVCSTAITASELQQLEAIIKLYCPLYTLDEMEQDHADTDYTGVDIAPPCFRMALEYTIENGALNVRLPANGIRYDEVNYNIGTISVLPYMGADNTKYKGYTFIPDGSGAIIRNEDVYGINNTISGSVYGADYAYHTVVGKQEEVMRYPVFGSVQSDTTIDSDSDSGNKTGYVAIITEGDSMATISAENGGILHKYNTVYAKFTPRPSDTYSLADVAGIGSTASWTVVSKRKYSGSYRIKYILLEDGSDYECSYVGMAKAYRDYLTDNGFLTKLTSDDVKENVPLYIETFGSMKTTDSFLSFPVTVDTPLTTFEDVKTMYNELSEAGVSNINFRLTGYTNGGLDSTYPAKVKFVNALGGNGGYKKLVKFAEENGFGVYPDFDFAYVSQTSYFDGYNAKKDAIKTIDSRYTSRRYYDSATQSLEASVAKAISPSRYEYFCGKFTDSYSKYDSDSLSLSTLGTTLNSDFDKEDPYNREDAKRFTSETLASLKESFGDIMVDGGNQYSLAYSDHIIGVATDSSNYMNCSATVPFAGFVLHGFTNYTGSAVNMEGDISYSILKSIENGASLYFTLSYENINELKESDVYNKYYSVDYSNWKDEVVNEYNTVNDALKSVQTSLMEEHEFLDGYRVPTEDEFKAEKAAHEKKLAEDAEKAAIKAEKDALRAKLAARKGGTFTPEDEKKSKATFVTKTASDGTVYLTDEKYVATEGTIVRVGYDNGTSVLINYNSYDVVTKLDGEDYVIKALSFIKID